MGRGEELISPPMPPQLYIPPWPFPGRCPCLHARSYPRPVLLCRPRCFFWCVQGKKKDVFSLSLPRQTNGETSFPFPPPPPFSPRAAERDSFLPPPPPSPLAPTHCAGRVWEGGEEKKREELSKKVLSVSLLPLSCPPRPNLEKGRWQRGRTRPAGRTQGKRRKADKLNPSVSVQISCKGSPQKRTYSILTGKIVARTIFYSVVFLLCLAARKEDCKWHILLEVDETRVRWQVVAVLASASAANQLGSI